MRATCFNFVLVMLFATVFSSHAHGQQCITLASGSFHDSMNWDCNCDPLLCDTLLVRHEMVILEDCMIDLPLVRVEQEASILAAQRLSMNGRIENEGSISAPWLWLHGSDDLVNTGDISGDVVVLVKDSMFNAGVIVGEDSLVVGFVRPFINSGIVEAGFLYELGYLYNHGEVHADSCVARFFINGDSFRVSGMLFVGSWFMNEGLIEAGAIQVVSGFENHGSIRCSDTFVNGLAAAESRIHEGADLQTVNFINPSGCHLLGPGTLCVSGTSENHGVISGPITICDITLPLDAPPPYLDVNTGGFLLPIYRCATGTCATVSIEEQSSSAMFGCAPMPAHEEAVLSFPGVAGSILLHDAHGRFAAQLQGPFHGEARIHRPGLPDGWYAAHVLGVDGGLLGTVRVLFIGP